MALEATSALGVAAGSKAAGLAALAATPGRSVGVQIAAGSYERLLFGLDLVHDSEAGYGLKPLFIYAPHTGCIKALASGDRFLASGSTDEVIRLYDIRKRTELGTLLQHQGSITALEFHKDTHLVSASEDGTVAIFRTSDWECLKVLHGHKDAILALAVHPSGKLALTSGADRTLRMWDLVTGRAAFRTKLPHAAEMVKWSETGKYYAIGMDRKVQCYLAETTSQLLVLERSVRVHQLAFSKDAYLVLALEDGTIPVYDIAKGTELFAFTGHTNRVKEVSLVEVPGTAQTLVVSASSDGYVRVWDLTASVRDGRAHPALIAFHADVRLTCVRAYVPGSATASTSKPVKAKATNKKRGDATAKPASALASAPAPAPTAAPSSAAGKPSRPAKASPPVPTAPKASASPAAKHAPAKPTRPAKPSRHPDGTRRKQPAM